jgi:hypothetical protein
MTPDQQIRAAVKVLNPLTHQRAACRTDIKAALDLMALTITLHTILAACRSKAHAKAIRAYYKALYKVRLLRA